LSVGAAAVPDAAALLHPPRAAPVAPARLFLLGTRRAGGSGTNTQTGLVTVLIPNPPQITSIQPMGTSALVLQGTGGPTNGGYYYWLRSSTNLTLPLTNWSLVATNPFDVLGNFSNQIPLTPGTPQTFYRLQMP
jgi:hypothetical protein